MGDTQSRATTATAPPDAEILHSTVHARDGEPCLLLGDVQTYAGCRLQMTVGKWKHRGGEPPEDIRIKKQQRDGTTDSSNNDATCFKLRRYGRFDRKPMELLLYNTTTNNQQPSICVISPKYGISDSSDTNSSSTNLYSTRPRFKGQIPAASRVDGNQQQTTTAPQFLWATIHATPGAGSPYSKAYFNTMEMIQDKKMNRGEDVASYRTEEASGSLGPQIVVYKGTKAAASIRISGNGEISTYDMTIAPGIDPCLMMALAAHIMNRKYVIGQEAIGDDLLDCCCSCFCPW